MSCPGASMSRVRGLSVGKNTPHTANVVLHFVLRTALRHAIARRSRLTQLVPSTRHFVASTGRLSSTPFHDFVESPKIGTRFPVLKKIRYLQGGQLFRHCRRHKLIDARTVFFALLFNRLLQRAWQTQTICARFRHFPILSIARRGDATWTPNRSRHSVRPTHSFIWE